MAKLTANEETWLATKHPSLVLIHRLNYTVLEGALRFHRVYENVPIEDIYKIRLELPHNPKLLPRLTETGGRLQEVLSKRADVQGPADLHAFPDWRLCLAAPQELRLNYLNNPSVKVLFDKYIEPYFYSQSYFEAIGTWPWRHLPHGVDGIIEWFANNSNLPGSAKETAQAVRELARDDNQRAIRMISRAMQHDSFAPRNKCLCGANQNYQQCHRMLPKLAIALRQNDL